MKFLFLFLFLFLFATSACTATDPSVPPDLAALPDLATATCGPLSLSNMPACNDCLATRCCAVAAHCTEPTCSDPWDHSAVLGCMKNACATSCNRDPAATKCGGIVASPARCASCVYEHCCDEAGACGTNDSCLGYVYQCLDKEGASVSTCDAMFPDGAKDFARLDACGVANCPDCF